MWTSCARLSVASDTITRVTEPAAQQPVLPGMPVRRSRAVGAQDIEPATVDPVARVVVDVPVPHLDRLFDYLVPSSMADAAQPGTRPPQVLFVCVANAGRSQLAAELVRRYAGDAVVVGFDRARIDELLGAEA